MYGTKAVDSTLGSGDITTIIKFLKDFLRVY